MKDFLQLADEDLGTAEAALAKGFARPAAYHVAQAVEKLARAVLDKEGIPYGTGHNIGDIAGQLPANHRWRTELVAFDSYSVASTAFRYPRPHGGLKAPPADKQLQDDISRAGKLAKDIAAWCDATRTAGQPLRLDPASSAEDRRNAVRGKTAAELEACRRATKDALDAVERAIREKGRASELLQERLRLTTGLSALGIGDAPRKAGRDRSDRDR